MQEQRDLPPSDCSGDFRTSGQPGQFKLCTNLLEGTADRTAKKSGQRKACRSKKCPPGMGRGKGLKGARSGIPETHDRPLAGCLLAAQNKRTECNAAHKDTVFRRMNGS